MAYNPYAPVQQALQNLGSTLERGLTRRAERDLASKRMDLDQEARLTGLGLQRERLGLERERLGEAKKTGVARRKVLGLQAEEAEKQAENLDAQIDPDFLAGVIGPEAMSAIIKKLPQDRTVITDDGTIALKQTNRQFANNLDLIKKIMNMQNPGGISKIIQDSKGQYHAVSTDKTTTPLGITGPLKDAGPSKITMAEFNSLLDEREAIRETLRLGTKKSGRFGEAIPLNEDEIINLKARDAEIGVELERRGGLPALKRKADRGGIRWEDFYVTPGNRQTFKPRIRMPIEKRK